MGNNNSTPFLKGDIIKNVSCVDISNLGFGVFKVDGYTIFAQDAYYDEVVDLKIYEVKKKFALAKVQKHIIKSTYRKDNVVNNVLNANRYINFDYAAQNKIKANQMSKLFNTNVEVIGTEDYYNYRNKSEFVYYNNKFNMYDEQNNLVEVKSCILSNPEINKVLPLVLEALNNNQKANISSVVFRYSSFEKKLMIILVASVQNKYHTKIAQEIIGSIDNIKSIILNYGTSVNYLFNDNEVLLYGEDYLIDTILNKQFKISSKSFYQVNVSQTEKLYKTVIEFANFKASDNVADLYCGVGTIGIIISDYVNSVLGVEVVADAVKAAKSNINLNEVRNYEVIEHNLDEDISILENIDVAIVDPPRNGLSKTIINNLGKSEVNKIVYVSCNPYTQARDLELFSQFGFNLIKIKAVDLFINTHHTESVILIER